MGYINVTEMASTDISTAITLEQKESPTRHTLMTNFILNLYTYRKHLFCFITDIIKSSKWEINCAQPNSLSRLILSWYYML